MISTTRSSADSRTKIRLLSGACGGVIVLTGLIIRDSFAVREENAQVAIWSAMVLAILLLGNRGQLRQRRFWWMLFVAGLLHTAFVFAFNLPFASMGYVILTGCLEAISLQMALLAWQRRMGPGPATDQR